MDFNNKIQEFVKNVLSASPINYNDYKILDVDLSRVYLAIDSDVNNYNIRMWNISNSHIDFTIFKLVEDHGETVCEGYYNLISNLVRIDTKKSF